MSATLHKSVIDEAVAASMQSPCVSKRGVVIVDELSNLRAVGFNDQPRPFVCDGSEHCKKNCGKTAVHAEQAALLKLNGESSNRHGWYMLHVKAKDEMPCASMAPSCLECSKLILASGIPWMHLLHDPNAQMLHGATVVGETRGFLSDGSVGLVQIRRYSAAHFHYLTAAGWHGIDLCVPEKPRGNQ